ncbi:hypothetical protein HDZ31DRAFT_81008 [Schizophyllum fasciatum]
MSTLRTIRALAPRRLAQSRPTPATRRFVATEVPPSKKDGGDWPWIMTIVMVSVPVIAWAVTPVGWRNAGHAAQGVTKFSPKVAEATAPPSDAAIQAALPAASDPNAAEISAKLRRAYPLAHPGGLSVPPMINDKEPSDSLAGRRKAGTFQAVEEAGPTDMARAREAAVKHVLPKEVAEGKPV